MDRCSFTHVAPEIGLIKEAEEFNLGGADQNEIRGTGGVNE